MNKNKKYSHIIWDWNGTLFDDVSHCIEVMNIMLAKRGLKPLANIAKYHEVFCFPVVNYYRKVGFNFDKEPFEKLAGEFIELYHSDRIATSKLHNNAELVLRKVNNKSIKQVILSASEIGNLRTQMSSFGIEKYFAQVLGTSDIYGVSKTEIALKLIHRSNVKSGLLIGDTEHDYEVAEKLGFDCVLIASGHQSKQKLLTFGVPVLDEVSEVLNLC